jgi:aspartyl-tRNA(Asn)/glutamyl-tRNA(Gln) amidotransferase subunit A
LLGTYALSAGYFEAYYKKASQLRALIKRDFERAFQDCDVIVGPTSPSPAFRFGEKTSDPLAMYLSDIYTLSANLAGVPGLSFNVGFDSNKLPIGLQLMGPWWEEGLLMGMAAFYQARRPDTLELSPKARAFAQLSQEQSEATT